MNILDVGQCGFDGPRMEQLFKERLNAKVANADTVDQACEMASEGKYDLILVNRKLAFDDASGLEVIKALREKKCDAPIMLVSDLEDAQEQAVACGAVRGFGKASLEDPATLELIEKTARVRGD